VAVVQYTFTHKEYIEQHNKLVGKTAWRAPSLGIIPLYLFTTEEKRWKNLCQGSQRMPVGKMKKIIQNGAYIAIKIHKHNNKNI
jgi:hypothetical protein